MPHVLLDSSVCEKLIGAALVVNAVIELGFNEQGRVAFCETSMCFVDALQPLLGSLKAAAFVLHDAFISLTGQIGRDLFEPSAPHTLSAPLLHGANRTEDASSSLLSAEVVDQSVKRDSRLELSFILAPMVQPRGSV